MGEYRPNVAAIMLNQVGEMLVCERLKVKGAWQFPQGGVDDGETLLEALKREVQEEIGIESRFYEIQQERGGYRYKYPQEVLKKKKKRYIGQEQTYFLCQLHENAPRVNLDQKPREFRDSQWIQPEGFKEFWLPDFKKIVYREVLKDFFGASFAK